MSAVPGTSRASPAKRLSPGKVVEMLATALRAFHSADPGDCLFKAYRPSASRACTPRGTPRRSFHGISESFGVGVEPRSRSI